MDSFEGRATLIMGDLIQVSDTRTGHSVVLPRSRIAGGDGLRLSDRVRIDGEPSHRRGRRIVPEPMPA